MISVRATRVLNIILLALILIFIRVWYLSVIQHEEKLIEAHKPQRRVVIEPVERATIRDRFGLPLAVNKIQYNAAVCYAHIREIPSISWQKNGQGKGVRVQARAEYIQKLATRLAKELNMDPVEIEDTIHGKASLFPHTPFVVKEDITEEQYYRLKMLEKDWLGLAMQRGARRCYPQGKVGCDVVGYLGAISQKKYLDIADEIRDLQEYILQREQGENPFLPKGFSSPLEVRMRLSELQEKSYTINDLIGKAGVEMQYEELLRGVQGRKTYEVDVKGNFLRELPGSKKALGGRQVILSISSELQAHVEQLLAAEEGPQGEESKLDELWMRGGAVVAMIPQTGEVVALASYPRFDPNDFIPIRDPEAKKEKAAAVQKWLEQIFYIGEIWDGKRWLEREYFSSLTGTYEEQKLPLTWDRYLETILLEGEIRTIMNTLATIGSAIDVQKQGIHHHQLRSINLDNDKLLLVDLCRLAASKESFSPELLQATSKQTLADYHLLRQEVMRLQTALKNEIQEIYHDLDFTNWRKSHFKEFLKIKRKEEREQKKYARPYTEYLDQVEKKLFQAFWEAYRYLFLYISISRQAPIQIEQYPHLQPYFALLKSQKQTSSEALKKTISILGRDLGLAYLQSMRSFDELNRPLLGDYKRLRTANGMQMEKHLAAAFYPVTGYGFGRSQAYREGSALGSTFKLVTAYQALLEQYQKNPHNLNPLTLIDDLKGDHRSNSANQVLGYTLDGHPILRAYKGGWMPRSSHSHIGKVDFLSALEQSSNIYFSILAAEHLEDPMNLAKAARLLGFGEKTGIDLPGEVKGHLPEDLRENRTGLYSLAIGHHTLFVTPLQTAVMASAIANRGKVIQPKIVHALLGNNLLAEDDALFSAPHFPFQNTLSLVGVEFPLFTSMQGNALENTLIETDVHVKRLVPFPLEVHQTLKEGMRRVVQGPQGTARPATMRFMSGYKDYLDMHRSIIGKTGTPQARYKQSLDTETESVMRRHVWFAAISYPDGDLEKEPELVVVAYLRYGGAGREAGPIIAQTIRKWRELCKKTDLKNRYTPPPS